MPGFQESKLREVSHPIIGEIFGNQNVGFAYSPAVDFVGTIICCGNSKIFTESQTI